MAVTEEGVTERDRRPDGREADIHLEGVSTTETFVYLDLAKQLFDFGAVPVNGAHR